MPTAQPVALDGKLGYVVGKDEPQKFTVDELCTRHLQRLYDSAKAYIGKPISGVVLCVPTNFSAEQRAALAQCANAAGMSVRQIINEPAAEYLALMESEPQDKTVVVADFGASRSDVSVASIRGGLLTILATSHDPKLGGDNLDTHLVEYFSKEYEKKYGANPLADARARAKLYAQAEMVKKSLSAVNSAPIAIDSLYQGTDFSSSINRLRFEILSKPVFDAMISLIEATVQKAGLDMLDVTEVIMAGGTSNVPKLVSRVQQLLGPNVLVRAPASTTAVSSRDPAELAACGAALHASLIADYEAEDVEKSTHAVITTAPHLAKPVGLDLSLGSGSSEFRVVLEYDSPLPARRSVQIPTDGSSSLRFAISEGERDIKVETVEPPARSDAGSDSDSDSDSDDEPQEIRTRIVKPGQRLAEVEMTGFEGKTMVEVTIQIDAKSELTFTARPMNGAKGESLRGTIPASA